MLYCSGISLAILPPPGRQRLFAVMERLRARGGKVAFDSNFRARLWPDRAAALACYDRAYALADLAFVSIDDEVALRGNATPDSVFGLPSPELVLKGGAASTWVRVTAGRPIEVPVQPVEAVDTTDAGDSFAGAYLAFRLHGNPPDVGTSNAARVARIVVSHRGAIIDAARMETEMKKDPLLMKVINQ